MTGDPHGRALVACTIIARNYLAYARVLAQSFLDHHPRSRFVVLLVDRVDGCFDPEREPFDVLEVEQLDNVPELRQFLFKYRLLELATAVKPYLLERLLDEGAERVLYLDPDIWVLHPLLPVLEGLNRGVAVLTPHIDQPLDDGAVPDELTLLRTGLYNLGFIGLRATAEARRLLGWWQERLFDRCVDRADQGLFVDQRWMDLAPLLFDGVEVLKQPGLNVAYWNLAHRSVVRFSGQETPGSKRGAVAPGRPDAGTAAEPPYLANGEPLYFFHFSGLDPERPDRVSKYQDRFRLADLDDRGDAGEIIRRYAARVAAAGHGDCCRWPCAFSRFDNGVEIPDAARSLFLSLDVHRRRRFGDPFRTAEAGASFFNWMNGPRRLSRPYLSRLHRYLLRTRSDLRSAFPDLLEGGAGLGRLVAWLENAAPIDHALDPIFLVSAHDPRRAGSRKAHGRLMRLYHSRAGAALRSALRRLIGRRLYVRLRRALIGPASGPAPPLCVSRPGTAAAVPAIRVQDEPGVNLIGYLQAETGMGEAARGLARALAAADVPLSLQSVDLGVRSRQDDRSFAVSRSDFRHDVNLMVVNADQVDFVVRELGPDAFAQRCTIGYWLWELELFPDRYHRAFQAVGEVWTPSRFCLDSLSSVSPVPVRRVPIPVVLPRQAGGSDAAPAADIRARLGLPEDRFLFLFTFSHLSYARRKNPFAAVEAFRRAFPEPDEFGVAGAPLLVLKSCQPEFEPEASAALAETLEPERVLALEGYLSRAETDALSAAADCHVSLHRSEGFGLTVAEAMAAGTPAIATGYGGVTDFFDADVGFPVRYERVELERDEGPYPAGAAWAEPDIDHAAGRMRQVFEQRGEAARRAERARRRIERDLSYEAVGERMQRLLLQVREGMDP